MAARTLAMRSCWRSGGSLTISAAKACTNGRAIAIAAATSGVIGRVGGLAVCILLILLGGVKVEVHGIAMLEAFTLIIWWSVGSAVQEHRTPGLPEIECKFMAAGVKAPKQAKCVREDMPSPDELPLPDHRPGAPP